MTELKPCPFCGESVVKVYADDLLHYAYIECISCGGQVRCSTSQDSDMGSMLDNLMDMWNKRAIE